MINPKIYKYLFFFIVAFYCLVLSQFGFENFDTGYIPSFSWRIINGQNVYEDFIYKGPPVTLYFHAIFMKILPVTGQFFFIRIVNYLLFALQVYFTVSAFSLFYDFKKVRIIKWAIMSVCFMVSLLNFSPYPWPTTDGLLFASVAFWLVAKNEKINFLKLFLIAFFTMLSALTKQSFYLIPLLFLIWIYIRYDLKKAIWFLLQLIFLAVVFLSLIASITTIQNFIKQTTGETHIHDLLSVGFHKYLFFSSKKVLFLSLLLLFVSIIYLYVKKQKQITLLNSLKWASIIMLIASIYCCLFKEILMASRLAFDACVIAVLYAFLKHKKSISYLAPIIVGLGIAWSASISLGFPYPILYSTAIILSIVILLEEYLVRISKYYFWICLPICFIALSYNTRPYREDAIFNLGYSLENVSPKLRYIKTSKSSLEKHLELKHLISKYGENFIVAPSLPMANYLFEEQSELPADWIINTETNRQSDLFIKLAADKKNYIFIEKSFLNKEEFVPSQIEKFSYISWFIYTHFNPIEETKYFIVYNSIKQT